MKQAKSNIAIIALLMLVIGCGDRLLDGVNNFIPNRAPIIESLTACHVVGPDCNPVDRDTLLPGNQFRVTVVAQDPDNNEMIITFLTDVGTFTNQEDSSSGGSAILTLPAIMPAGLSIRIGVRINDPKQAQSIEYLDLGSGKIGLNVTSSVGSSYIHEQSSTILQFQASGDDGFFQTSFVNTNDQCVFDPVQGYAFFSVNTPVQIRICGKNIGACTPIGSAPAYTFPALNARKKVCLFIKDNLLQEETLSFTLTSDDTIPVASMTPWVDTAIMNVVPPGLQLDCTDNFECDKICYNTAHTTGGSYVSPANPDCAGVGSTVAANSFNLASVLTQGDGRYRVRYFVVDKSNYPLEDATGSAVTPTPIEVSFHIDSNSPILTINSLDHTIVSTAGFTQATLNWQSSKANNNDGYQIRSGGTDCTDGSVIFNDPSSSIAANVAQNTIINASALPIGANSLRVCYNSNASVMGAVAFSIERDETAFQVDDSFPLAATTEVPLGTAISVNFNKPANPASVTANTSDTTCSGTIQLSADGFTTCVRMAAAPTATNPLNTAFQVSPASALTSEVSYQVRVPAGSAVDLANKPVGAHTPGTFQTADNIPPTFAGLSGASEVDNTTAGLSWAAASDGVSATANIFYRIYQATIAGGQNFASPTFQTAPGDTSANIGGLVAGQVYYFVVRSVDQAGNEDSNVVEMAISTGSPMFVVSAISGNTTEAGGSATFTVRLNSQPDGVVNLGMVSNDASEGTVSPASLAFSTADWNADKVVTVTGVDDAATDGDVSYAITFTPATGADTTGYVGMTPSAVTVVNLGDDPPGWPSAIAGDYNITCGAVAVPFSVTAAPGALSHTWTAPPGITIASGQGTTAITVNVQAGFTAGDLTVAGVNGFGTGPARKLRLAVNQLLTNGSGQSGLTGWTLTQNGGNGWGVDAYPRFRTSWQWNAKVQQIDLVAAGFSTTYLDSSPPIRVYQVFGNIGWNVFYYFNVQLLDAASAVIGNATWGSTSAISPTPAIVDYTFTGYPAGVRYIRWEDRGKDSLGWAGRYGATMTGGSLSIGPCP